MKNAKFYKYGSEIKLTCSVGTEFIVS